ncbi:PIN-like domain-containing protein [Micromonospora zhanjiangensis]|uniref:VapC45 PIN like domain-containing protein n=1 Tax=Micromonospora zhanjiangensis TaxID=1522057 RepID=A0ABV8KRL4_9ACTN
MTRSKPADVRFYFDADIRGLGMLLSRIRPDVTYPGDPGGEVHKRIRPPCVVKDVATPDDAWIPQVTEQGWLIITRDRHIRVRPREIAAVRDYGARLVALTAADATTIFNQLEVVMCRWRDIVNCLDRAGPFIYTATRSTFEPVSLTPQ